MSDFEDEPLVLLAPCTQCGETKDVCCDEGYRILLGGKTEHDEPFCRECCPRFRHGASGASVSMDRHGRHRCSGAPRQPVERIGPRVPYSEPLAPYVPSDPKPAPVDAVARMQEAPVSCSCGWIGSLGGLTDAGKCPGCRSQKGLVRL